MKITIHRGSHEIGGSCVEVEGRSGSRLLIDVGQPLMNTEKQPPSLPDRLDGVLISHAHQDHYGLLDLVGDAVPCYLSAPTRRLIELTGQYTGKDYSRPECRTFSSHRPFSCGEFRITPFLVDHSAFDAHGFLIEDGENRIFYSGDFRGHGRKAALLDRLEINPPAPVDALLLEGTMLGNQSEKIRTEQEIEEKVAAKLQAHRHIAFVTVSGQNIDRLVSLYRACVRSGRKLVIDPYVGHVLREIHAFSPNIPFPSMEYGSNLRVYFPQRLCRRMRLRLGLGHLLDEFGFLRIRQRDFAAEPGRYLVMARDSMASELSEQFGGLAENALFLYSLWRGYWEEEKMQILRCWVGEQKMNLVNVHTSGHAHPATLQRLAEAMSPKQIIPIHTLFPEEYQALFRQPVRIVRDGEEIVLSESEEES